MNHRVSKHSFGRRPGPRKALIRGLVDSLVEHGRIKTTVAKAKEVRRHVEKAVTQSKDGSVHARRVLLSKYPNKKTVSTLVDDIGPRFKERPGGYTRILKLGNRPGDNAEMAYLEFVDFDVEKAQAEKDATPSKTRLNELARRNSRAKKARREMQEKSRRINR